jgi:hypothetical protein
MVRSKSCAANKRTTASTNAQLVYHVKDGLIKTVGWVLQSEMQAVTKDPRARVRPEDSTPAMCAEFDMATLRAVYSENASILWALVISPLH